MFSFTPDEISKFLYWDWISSWSNSLFSLEKFKLSSKGRFYKDVGYENYSYEATTYVKTESDVMDYDFKSSMCIPPKDSKKTSLLKKLTKKHLKEVGGWIK